MATVYKVEIVSDWINYTEEELKTLIEENLDPDRQNIRVTEVERKQVEPLNLLRDADTITLSRKDAEVFFSALSELKEANEALKAAAKLYQK